MPPRLAALAAILAATVALLAPAMLDGRPSAFSDTAFYYSQGEAFARLLNLAASDPTGARDPTSVVENDARAPPTPLDQEIGARSPVYGLLLYGLTRLGSLWLAAVVQAFLAALALFLSTRAFRPKRLLPAYALTVGCLVLGSALPFLTGFAMPDVFGGLAALCTITLLAGNPGGRAATAALWAILALATACHGAYPPIVLVIAAAAAAPMAWRGPAARLAGRAGLVASAVVAALLAYAAAFAAHQTVTGHAEHAPPFLTARTLADGPGRTYLRAVCRGESRPFALCPFMDRPLADSDEILWADDPARGVFSVADVGVRQALEREQMRFVFGAVSYAPLQAVAAAMSNTGRQLLLFHVDDELRDPVAFWTSPYFARTRLVEIVPGIAGCRTAGRCASPIPIGPLRALDQGVLLCALVFLGWRLTRSDVRGPPLASADLSGNDAVLLAVALVAVAVVANAAISGALSGPFPRYGARIVWLVVWIAVVTATRFGASPPASSAEHR